MLTSTRILTRMLITETKLPKMLVVPVEPVADDHAAEEMDAEEESTFTPNFLTGVFTWGGIAGLPDKRKSVVLQYRAFAKEGPGGEVFFYKINHLCDAL